MNWLGSMVIAFSMYSRIPMPKVEWTKERMRYAMCYFPLIGAVIGLVYAGYGMASEKLDIPQTAYACMGTVIPLLITGGIHMDGYLDTCDARSSYGDREKKLEILKDPHTGAFALIHGGIYLLVYTAVFSMIPPGFLSCVGGSCILSRALSGYGVVAFPKAKNSGLAAMFSDGAEKRTVKAVMILYAIAAGIWMAAAGGVILAAGCVMVSAVIFLDYRRMAVREFGGITGDLAGYFLQRAELGQLLMIAAVAMAGGIGT